MKLNLVTVIVRCLILWVSFTFGALALAEQTGMNKSPAPAWVTDIPVKKPDVVPEDQIKSGVYYLLVDRQMKVGNSGKPLFYNHYADYIVNQNGLDSSSHISISFDPGYQTLTFHRLRLIRDGSAIDKLDSAKFSLLQREEELEKRIYDGRLSANIILDDVRVGDVVDYSYTIEGTNPVYGNIFSYSFYTQWSVPLQRQFVRVLWEKDKPLKVTPFNQAQAPQIISYAGGVEYRFDLADSPPLTNNSQVPAWYDPYDWVFLSDSETWQDIVNWALPLYQPVGETSSKVEAVAAQILQQHSSVDARIHAALAFVQADIRYLGLEMGENSHKPSPAADTLERRYGDCKDKTVLLIALLKEMDISAHPALVNSTVYKELAKYPPATSAFDHVIVHLRHQDKDWWLDPTRQYQQASLDTVYQPDFGYALIVAPGEKSLTAMTATRVAKQVIHDEFDLTAGTEGKAQYTVVTRYYGREAERQRNSLAESSNSDIAEQYLNYYKDFYPNIVALSPLSIIDQSEDMALVVTEAYEVENIWTENTEDNRYTLDFFANSIDSAMVKVEETKRTAPFYLRYPHQVVQTIEIKLPDSNWSFDEEVFSEKNSFFEYNSKASFNRSARILTLHYEYQSLADQVPADLIEGYIKARKRVIDNIEYSIYFTLNNSESDDSFSVDSELTWLVVGVLVYIAIILGLIVSWNHQRGPRSFRQYLRYGLLLLVVVPPVLLYVAVATRFIPDAEVVKGEDLLLRDIKFMQRNKLLQPNETLLYFYSDALLDFRKDGNGLTPERIFSYWRDEDGGLSLEVADLNVVERFEFAEAASWSENSTLTVYREDGSDFMLYLSAQARGDQKFKKAFVSRWRKARMKSELERAFPRIVADASETKKIPEGVRRLIGRALFNTDSAPPQALADLYSQGSLVKQDLRRAIYFYELAHAREDKKASLALAWHLAVADPRVQDVDRALSLAHDLVEEENSARGREVLAAAYAATGDYQRAVAEQQRAIALMPTQEPGIAAAQEKLAHYQSSRPWIQLWPNTEKGNSEHRPLIKVAPQYPKRALKERITGHIVFSYDVQSNGLINNIKVVEEHPQGYFEAAGRSALKRFIYQPAYVDGKTVTTEGVTNKFIFELND